MRRSKLHCSPSSDRPPVTDDQKPHLPIPRIPSAPGGESRHREVLDVWSCRQGPALGGVRPLRLRTTVRAG